MEVESRELPNVTLIDLPGLFFARNLSDQSVPECTKVAQSVAVAAAIVTAPQTVG